MREIQPSKKLTRQQEAQKQKIIGDVHTAWARERYGTIIPDDEYSTSDPSQYPEHAILFSSDAAAQTDLLERTTAALQQAGLLDAPAPSQGLTLKSARISGDLLMPRVGERGAHLFAVNTPDEDEWAAWAVEHFATLPERGQGWRDQLRIPKGNGKRSGRWTFTPWKFMDDLSSLVNALGSIVPEDTRATIMEAFDEFDSFDPDEVDLNDPAFREAATKAANTLDTLDRGDSPELSDALFQTSAGLRDFAATDWTLMPEDTDIGRSDAVAAGGRATGKHTWDGDLPTSAAVDKAYDGKTSEWLANELQRIADHPVAPSPSARRKRAAYMKELQDRRDRDAGYELPEPPKEEDLYVDTAPKPGEPGYTEWNRRDQTHKSQQRAIRDSLAGQPGLSSVGRRMYVQQLLANLRGLVAQEGDKNSVFWSDEADTHLQNMWKALDGGDKDLWDDSVNKLRVLTNNELSKDNPWQQTVREIVRVSPLWRDDFIADFDQNKHNRLTKNLRQAQTPKELADALEELWQQSTDATIREQGGGPGWEVSQAFQRAMERVRSGNMDFEVNIDRLITLLEKSPNDKWSKQYLKPMYEIKQNWPPKLAAYQFDTEGDLGKKFGMIPESERTPDKIIEVVSMPYAGRSREPLKTRKDKRLNSNCVLATASYEMRRRGLNVHPKGARAGKYADWAYSIWFKGMPGGYNKAELEIPGKTFENRRGSGRYKIITAAMKTKFPPNSRGMIHCSWKDRDFGHIWNWEIDANGKLVFYDAQTGERIGPDHSHWENLANRTVGISRLDDKALAPDIEVMIADIEARDRLEKNRALGIRVTRLRNEKDNLGRETNKLEAAYKTARKKYGLNHPETQKTYRAYTESYANWMKTGIEIEEIFKTPEGKALYEASVVDFPELHKDKVRL